MPEIVSIVYKPNGLGEDPATHYLRVSVAQAELVAGRGIKGDLKGVANRPLNIMSAEVLAKLAREGFKTDPGQMGEQLVVSGLDVNTLAAGSRLQIGDAAVVEIIKPRTGCDRFEAIQDKTAASVQGRMGMMARVIVSGAIRAGDSVKVLEPEKFFVASE
jgi:MOSC domain-containing protein YiiM